MGRPRVATAILTARGSRNVRGREQEPHPPVVMPDCPAHLCEDARKEWERVSKMLFDVGLLTCIDGDQLALYCVAYARWADAERQLALEGTVVRSPTGYPIQNPYLSIANGAMDQCFKYLAKFGMNPSDRSRVKVGTKPADRPATLSDFRLKIAK